MRPVGRNGAVREYTPPAETGWVALVGEFKKPGSYEVGGSIALSELLRRCDGLTDRATKTLQVVRNGLPAGTIYSATEANISLRPGDLIVAEGAGTRRFGDKVTFAGYENRNEPAGHRAGVHLGLVGLLDKPVAVRIPGDFASVAGVLQLSRQTHLTPRDVTVLLGGSRKVSGDKVIELTSGSVLLFDARQVSAEEVEASGLAAKTRFYPVQSPPSELPTEPASPATAPEVPAPPESMSAPSFTAPSSMSSDPAALALALAPPATPNRTAARPSAAPDMSLIPGPPEDRIDLSPLPKVENLTPPADEPPLRYPRTADASGTVPVGPPDTAEPHISRMPAESVYGTGDPSPTMAPEPPASSGPGDLSDAETLETADDPSFESLVVTVLIGGALGAATFLGLRRYRGRRLLAGTTERLVSRFRRDEAAADAATSALPRSAAPADLLAALVADRLALREEPVELPSAIRIYGRSSAMKRLRIDPPVENVVPEPHIPLSAPVEVGGAAKAEAARKSANLKTNFRVDPAQPVVRAGDDLPSGTPFERALAARKVAARD